jgi:hypothetical protein
VKRNEESVVDPDQISNPKRKATDDESPPSAIGGGRATTRTTIPNEEGIHARKRDRVSTPDYDNREILRSVDYSSVMSDNNLT